MEICCSGYFIKAIRHSKHCAMSLCSVKNTWYVGRTWEKVENYELIELKDFEEWKEKWHVGL